MEQILEMKGIVKVFGNGVQALRGADLSIQKGEIHALVGENAAGKSTLMNVLYGMIRPDKGTIRINGEECTIAHPNDAIQRGIGMVHQHVNLVPEFTALENIILGKEYRYTNQVNKIDFKKARKDVEELLVKINIDIDLSQKIEDMSIGKKSKTEIIKALFAGSNIIIFDEPTTILAPNEVDSFLEFLRTLKAQGYTMIYISHRLKEIFNISDAITVLRKGKTMKVERTANANMEQIAAAMIGRDVKTFTLQGTRNLNDRQEPVLSVKNLSVNEDDGRLEDINLTVHRGEVLGIAGVEGNGQAALSNALIGLTKIKNGSIFLNGKEIRTLSTSQRRALGIHYVPEDRMSKGLALDMSIVENAILGYERSSLINKKQIMSWGKAREFAERIVTDFKVEGSNDVKGKIRNLSGGNMQKLILGRELITDPALVILSQPTVGLDFDSQRHIHEKILSLRDQGISFLLISTDIDEVTALSDRILALYRGRIVKEFPNKDTFDCIEIGYYITGVKEHAE